MTSSASPLPRNDSSAHKEDITHNKPHLHIEAGQRGRVVNASGCYPDSLGSASSNLAVVFCFFGWIEALNSE